MFMLMYGVLILIILFEVFSILKPIFKSWQEYESVKEKTMRILMGILISTIAGYLTYKIGTGIIFLF